MPLMRFSVVCLVALASLGSSYAVAGGPIPGKPGNLSGNHILVEICFGDACGPKAFSRGQLGGFPAIARQAGAITASRPLNFRCPGTCEGATDRPTSVTIRAVPRRGAYTEFDHWEGACARSGTVPTCTITVQGRMNVRAVFQRYH